jgi:hypothetical protein
VAAVGGAVGARRVVILEPSACLGPVLHLEVTEGRGLVAGGGAGGVLALPPAVGRREEGLRRRRGEVVGWGSGRRDPHGEASAHHLGGGGGDCFSPSRVAVVGAAPRSDLEMSAVT